MLCKPCCQAVISGQTQWDMALSLLDEMQQSEAQNPKWSKREGHAVLCRSASFPSCILFPWFYYTQDLCLSNLLVGDFKHLRHAKYWYGQLLEIEYQFEVRTLNRASWDVLVMKGRSAANAIYNLHRPWRHLLTRCDLVSVPGDTQRSHLQLHYQCLCQGHGERFAWQKMRQVHTSALWCTLAWCVSKNSCSFWKMHLATTWNLEVPQCLNRRCV